MSDHNPENDPIDQAYVEAEAMLSDEAARAARRARVLAAVADEPAAQPAAPITRRPAWPPNRLQGGWLAAASVVALSAIVAIQIYRPPPHPTQPAPATPVTAAAASKAAARPPKARARPATIAAPPPPLPRPPVLHLIPPPPLLAPAPQAFPKAASPKAAFPKEALPGVVVGGLPPAAPPPPPPAALAAAPPPAPASDDTSVGEVVVTAAKRASNRSNVPMAVTVFTAPASSDQAARLQAAAAAGRTDAVKALLRKGAPVDATDAAGDTALMNAVQADHPATAALLLRHGASLDAKNTAGESARDMAAAVADPALNRVLGLAP